MWLFVDEICVGLSVNEIDWVEIVCGLVCYFVCKVDSIDVIWIFSL